MNGPQSDEGSEQPSPESTPDILVISGDHTFMFEPQNARGLELLQQCCGLPLDVGQRVRVHPSRCEAILNFLRIAGLRIVSRAG